MYLYVSGPYSGEVDRNIAQARQVALALWEAGHAVLCPHLNTAHFEADCKLAWDDYIRADLTMLARCDGIVMTPDWENSRGARVEHDYAVTQGIPIWVYPNIPPLHITEQRCPAQVKAFGEIIGQMYRTHLKKNADYSPANILLTGEVGLVTRLWDKVARLLNLSGFVLRVEAGAFDKALAASNEPLEDAYMDAAVYAIIGLLLRRGVWGK